MRVLVGEENPNKQLEKRVIERCRECLINGIDKKKQVDNIKDFQELQESLKKVFLDAFPKELYVRDNALNSRIVSEYEFDKFRIQNVIFESFPGWEVNATVYLPKEKGKYPGIICPTGHSSKTKKSYQTPCQFFAMNGYIAISFDPPGCAGEKQYLNDHFNNGILGYLTGLWSQSYFVIDALRCIDYLESREDIDKTIGFSATGVSGGGLTSIFTAVIDERIKFYSPVCCLSKHEDIHFNDLYTSCPEQFGYKYIEAGLDSTDYLFLAAPKECLICAGGKDEVFNSQYTKQVYMDVKKTYSLFGKSESIDIFIEEESGHSYTLKMAKRVVLKLNKIFKKEQSEYFESKAEDIRMLDESKLMCFPSEETNMFTINKEKAEELKKERKINYKLASSSQKILEILGLTNSDYSYIKVKEEVDPPLRWFHYIKKIDIIKKEGVHIPGIEIIREGINGKRPALIHFDDEGKWTGFKNDNFLSKAGGFLRDVTKEEPIVCSFDISGFGELAIESTPYDLASWNDSKRILSYLAIASGKPLMGYMTEDILTVLKYIEQRQDIDQNSVILSGKGEAALPLLFAGLIYGKASKIILSDMLGTYQELIDSFPNAYNPYIIVPDILKYSDIPEIIENMLNKQKVILINPLGADGTSMDTDKAGEIFKKGTEKGLELHCGKGTINSFI